MIIPTIPSLPAGYVAAAADLNNVAAACNFLLAKPRARVHDAAGGQTLGSSSSSPTTINFGTKDYDNDGCFNSSTPSLLTIQTPGWYRIRYSVQVTTTASGYVGNSWVAAVAGPNNPLGNGNQIAKALYGYCNDGVTFSTPCFVGAAGVFPAYLYAGDTVMVRVYSYETGDHTSATAGWPASSLSILFASA